MTAARWVFLAAACCAAVSATAQEAGGPDGGIFFFPAALAVDTTGNSVLEVDETAIVAPGWVATPASIPSSSGRSSNFTGPAGAVYANPDTTALYLYPAPVSSCTSSGDCYTVRVSAAPRPVMHWDATILEVMD